MEVTDIHLTPRVVEVWVSKHAPSAFAVHPLTSCAKK